MRRPTYILVVLALLFSSFVPVTIQGADVASAALSGADTNSDGESTGMPGRPIPTRPIPHHEVGRPSKAAQYTSDVVQVDDQGVQQITTLTGLDALLSDGIIDDPLAGNPRMVNLDKIMYSSFLSPNFAGVTFDITPTLDAIPGSYINFGNFAYNDIAAGDLNEDGQAEQIAAWIGAGNYINMSISEISSLNAKTTSMPVALAYSDGTADLLVRGYDDALWHSHYDGSSWGAWDNAGGGTLLSAPAIVSRGVGQFDVFAFGTDNLIYQRHWETGVFTGDWQLVDVPGDCPEPANISYMPGLNAPSGSEVNAPAAVARSAGQLDLFRRGSDNTLCWSHFDGAFWGEWQSLGGFISTPPAAISLPADGMQVFGRGLDEALWYRIYTGSHWGRWERLDMPADITVASAPTLASPQAGQIKVYIRGSDDALWQVQYDGALWGDWASGGGILGSGVGAAVWADQVDLFAQNTDGTLQHSTGASDWADWANLPAQQVYVTEAITASGSPGELENGLIDIDTGYFTGDGRDQIVVAYALPGGQFKIELYDIRNGFAPIKLAETDPLPGFFPRIATGDWTGDGVDEIAVVHLVNTYRYKVTVYSVDLSSWTGNPVPIIPLKSSPIIHSCLGSCSDPADQEFWFAGTMRISAGDLDGDTKDEVVVLSDWGDSRVYEDYALWVQLYIFDDYLPDDVVECRAGQTGCLLADTWVGESDDDKYWDNGSATGVGLAVGDVNLDLIDEIVVTWPGWFNGSDWPDLERYLRVLDASGVDADNPYSEELVSLYIGWSRVSFLDTLAVGDLDRDLIEEIVLYTYDGLFAYKYNDQPSPVIELIDSKIGLGNPNPQYSWFRSVKLVTGDYTAESLRLGTPTYRLQRNTGEIIALLNEPPKHIDTLGGVTYDVNSTDTGTYAAYENSQSESTEMSVQVSRGWGFASGMEMNVGDPEGTHVKDSLNITYGEHFTRTQTAFNTVAFGSEVKATSDDIVYYTGQDVQVWEYPAYENDSRVPTGRIMVTFPLPGASNTGIQKYFETGNSTCNFWYAPEHQLNNMWSYAQLPVQLKDYDPERGVVGDLTTRTVGPIGMETWTSWADVTEDQRSSSLSLDVDSLFEAQIGGDSFEVSAAPFGVGVSYEVHLPYVKTTIEESYSAGTLSTQSVVGSTDTTIRVIYEPIDAYFSYEVTPYLYWSKGGYLVLDYLTNPKDDIFWDAYYVQPDPAFILPWADGHCTGKAQFSKDIMANPPLASNGETVVITATVHNFSDESADSVLVRFYLGDPSQNDQIGFDQTISLPARAMVDVSVEWQASGTGEQRIYAVIDPNHVLTEMHDETTNPENNNNIAFGVVAMGDSGYVDPGGQVYFDYQYLTYTDTNGLATNAFIPTAVMTESLRIEMEPLPDTGRIQKGFSLAAYKGGSQRDMPWDLTFQPMPAGIWLRYSDEDIAGLDESTLLLYRYDPTTKTWVDAACGQYQRYPEDNWMLVPVCQTGDFALLSLYAEFYLPMISR